MLIIYLFKTAKPYRLFIKNSKTKGGWKILFLRSLENTIKAECATCTKQQQINNRNAENRNRLKRKTCNSEKLFTN